MALVFHKRALLNVVAAQRFLAGEEFLTRAVDEQTSDKA